MVIYENNFPQFLESIAIGPDASFLEKNTTNCEFVSAFPEELDLIYTLKDAKRSSDPLNHLRHFVKKVCIFGPDLDTPTLNHMVNSYNRFPPYHRDIIDIEIGLAFNKARKLAKSPTNCNSLYKLLGVKIPLKIPIPDDLNFICKLADGLRGCKKPCNYFKKTGDSMGILSDFMRGMSTNSNILGDIASDVIHAPLNIATNVYNKINPLIRKEFVALSISSERLVKEGVAPFFPTETKKKITDAVNKGGTTDKIRHALAGDFKTYHAVSKTSSSVVSKIQQHLGDCFRKYDHGVRYNPYDPMYNSAYSKRTFIGFKNGGVSSLVDLNGWLAPGQRASDNTDKRSLDSRSDSNVRKNSDSFTASKYDTYNNPNAGSEKTIKAGDAIPQDEPSGGKTYTFDYGQVIITHYGYVNEDSFDPNSAVGRGVENNLLEFENSIAIDRLTKAKYGIKNGSVLIITIEHKTYGRLGPFRRQVVDQSADGQAANFGAEFLIDEYDPLGISKMGPVLKEGRIGKKNYQVTITIADQTSNPKKWTTSNGILTPAQIVSTYASAFNSKKVWDRTVAAFKSGKSADPAFARKMETEYIQFVKWS